MASERAVIYVESGTTLRSSATPEKSNTLIAHPPKMGSNYVIKIQIGEETMFNPVRIDVTTGRAGIHRAHRKDHIHLHSSACSCEEESSSGQSSPRSDMTPPPRMNLAGSANRFGSETSESDTESDISSEFRPLSCAAAQFAMREICEVESPSSPSRPPSGQGEGAEAKAPISPPKSPERERKASPLQPTTEKGDNILGAIMTLSESMALKRAKKAEELAKKGDIIYEESGFHVNEMNGLDPGEKGGTVKETDSMNNFAGYRDIFSRRVGEGTKQILSDKGTIRGVKNRVRDGIATFLQDKDTKTYSEKEQGRVVVYTTSMGVVRATFQRCQKVKQILRNLLVKFDERDCYMNRSVQNEIRQRLPHHKILALPQIFLEGQLLGDAEVIEKLNETGELRELLKPYKSLSVLSTCEKCGGFRMLPCPICNGSKKSVHRNHFTTEFIALKCMHCDPSGLVRCDLCNAPDA